MEHYKSTFAVTGLAVLGLVAAAGILHPANFERSQRLAAGPAVSVAAPGTATAWVDPPEGRRPARRRTAPLPDLAALMKAEPTTVLPADGTMVQPLPAGLTQVAATAGRAEAVHGRRVARRAATTRQVALNRQGGAMAGPEPRAGQPVPASEKTDPIGDLIRGLGLGSNS